MHHCYSTCTVFRTMSQQSASVFSTSHDPTNGRPNAADVLQEVNQALQPKENGGSKRKYTTSFTPEDRARIGKYASEKKNVNTAAVKKFKATHEIGESTVRLYSKVKPHPYTS